MEKPTERDCRAGAGDPRLPRKWRQRKDSLCLCFAASPSSSSSPGGDGKARASEAFYVAWPRGWYLLAYALEDDEYLNRSDLDRWEREYTCCAVGLAFAGRVLRRGATTPRNDDPVILISEHGQIFCYCGWQDEALYFVGEDADEFFRHGLRNVEWLYGNLLDADAMTVYESYRCLMRAVETGGLPTVSTRVIRLKGAEIALSYPPGSRLRVCNLRCFRRNPSWWDVYRGALEQLGETSVPLGAVIPRDSYGAMPMIAAKRLGIPVFLTESGRVFAYDVRRRCYVRVANSLLAFAGMGMLNYYENYRFCLHGREMSYDRRPACPLTGELHTLSSSDTE